jgi:hypothetical protein
LSEAPIRVLLSQLEWNAEWSMECGALKMSKKGISYLAKFIIQRFVK